MKYAKSIIITIIVLGILFIASTPFIINMKKKGTLPDAIEQILPVTDLPMIWGATIRPYAITYSESNLEKQFQYLVELFPKNVCARVNIEEDMDVNDALVEFSEKYNTRLYFILEEDIDFNRTDIDYKLKAQKLAQKIVTRYKGKVEYYQLMNEISGVVVSGADDTGEKVDAGYGLTADKTRYNNVLAYTKELSKQVRELDPRAKIIISGHWVLIEPIISMINAGVDVDIVGWNWGSGLSSEPGIMEIDNYGVMDIPQKVAALGKKFWLVEANKDDGSYGDKDIEQAEYIKVLATAARDAKNVQGYFHFTLTDMDEEGPAGALGLIRIRKVVTRNNKWIFDGIKPAFTALQQVAAGK